MKEVKVDTFSGIRVLAKRRELEIPKEASLRKAKNVTINPDGSLSIVSGSLSRGSGTPYKFGWYANSIDRYIFFDPVNTHLSINAVDDTDGDFNETASFTGGADYLEDNDVIIGTGPTMVDWIPSKNQYFSTGGLTNVTKVIKLSSTGTAISSFVPEVSTSVHILCAHKGTLWFADRTKVYPSAPLNPESFDITNGILVAEGSAYITGMHSTGGVLFVHEKNDITAIFGNDFIAPTADVRRVRLNTGAGMIRPSAHWVWNGICYFIGMDGFYMFDGQTCKPIPHNLGLELARKLV